MKESLAIHFKKFKVNHFIIFTILCLIVLDLISFVYLANTFKATLHSSSSLLWKLLSARFQVSPSDLNPEFMREFAALMLNTIYLIVFVIFTNNVFFYTFFYKKKKWAFSYVSSYCFFGALLNVFMIFDPNSMGVLWAFINTAMVPAYLYFFLGLKFLKPEIIPVLEKKEL